MSQTPPQTWHIQPKELPQHQGQASPYLLSTPFQPPVLTEHTGLRPSLSQESSDTTTNSHLWQHHFFEMLFLLTLPPFLFPSKLLIRRPDDMGRSKSQACPSDVHHGHLRASHYTSYAFVIHYGLSQSQGVISVQARTLRSREQPSLVQDQESG